MKGFFEPDVFYPGTYLKYYIIPMTSQELGTTMTLPSSPLSDPPPPNGQHVSLWISPYVLNGTDHVGYATDIHASPDPDLQATVTVDYLPGCNLEYLGRQTKTLPLRNPQNGDNYDRLALFWSGVDLANYPEPYFWGLSHTAPSGPMKLSVQVEGYTTDSLVLSPTNLMVYNWTPLLSWLSGNVWIPTGLEFARVIPPWMRPLIDEIKEAILFSVPGPDWNNDGAVDAGDLMDVLRGIP